MATTTTTTTPTGSSTSTTRTYQGDKADNKALYWVLAAVAVIIIGGLIYAYTNRPSQTVTPTSTIESTTTQESSSSSASAPANNPNGAAAGTQMNMGTSTDPRNDGTAQPQDTDATDAPATPATPPVDQ